MNFPPSITRAQVAVLAVADLIVLAISVGAILLAVGHLYWPIIVLSVVLLLALSLSESGWVIWGGWFLVAAVLLGGNLAGWDPWLGSWTFPVAVAMVVMTPIVWCVRGFAWIRGRRDRS